MKKLLLIILILFSLKLFAYENVYPSYYWEANIANYEPNIRATTSCDDLKKFKKDVRNLYGIIGYNHDQLRFSFNDNSYNDNQKIISLSVFADMIVNIANRDYLLKKFVQ